MHNVSLNALLAEGWTRCQKPLVPFTSWPAADRIVLQRGEEVRYTVYSVYADSSDWPGDDWPVTWTEATLVPVELFEVRSKAK